MNAARLLALLDDAPPESEVRIVYDNCAYTDAVSVEIEDGVIWIIGGVVMGNDGRLRVEKRGADLKLIDELLCDLKQATKRTWEEMETYTSVTRDAMSRLREAYFKCEIEEITLGMHKYFNRTGEIMIIEGDYNAEDWYAEVRIDGQRLDPKPSLKIRNHSPDGFAWGYGGSGPAQLALAILLTVLPEHKAVALYQRFKAQIIAPLPRDSFRIEVDIEAWVAENEKTVAVSTDDAR